MTAEEFTLAGEGGTALFVRRWAPSSHPEAVVQIAHGLAEHSGRYSRFAEALTQAGYLVIASDHRGHGKTAPSPDDLGYFAQQDGWNKCLADLWMINRQIARDTPGTPIVLFGHSMGSFMVQALLARHSRVLAGAILSGSNGAPPAIALFGRMIARIERWRMGPRGRSALLRRMMFGEFNKKFAPNRTAFDWLSRDTSTVDAYIDDPLCGSPFSTQLAIDLLDALAPLTSPEALAAVDKGLPILILSGSRDPVGSNLGGLIAAYRKAGIKHAEARIYPGGRHEMLNETNGDEVFRDILHWLKTIRTIS